MSDIQTPLEPQKTTSYRLMLAVVIFLGVLIVIAVCIMVAGLLMKFRGTPPRIDDVGMFALPANAQVLEMQSQQNRLILHIRTPSGDEVDIIDVSDGHVISRIKSPK